MKSRNVIVKIVTALLAIIVVAPTNETIYATIANKIRVSIHIDILIVSRIYYGCAEILRLGRDKDIVATCG